MQTPASRYGVSRRPMPTILAPPEYEPQTPARKVQTGGWISFKDRLIACSRAFTGRHLALRATATDGVLQLCYRRHVLAQVDMRQNSLTSVHHLPEHPFTSSPV